MVMFGTYVTSSRNDWLTTVCSDCCSTTLTQWENRRVTLWSLFRCHLKIWDRHQTNCLTCVCFNWLLWLRMWLFFALSRLSHFYRISLLLSGSEVELNLNFRNIHRVASISVFVFTGWILTIDLRCLRCWDCSSLCSRLNTSYNTARKQWRTVVV